MPQPRRDGTRRGVKREVVPREFKGKMPTRTNRLTDAVALGNYIAFNDSKKTLVKRQKKKAQAKDSVDGHKSPNL